MFNCNLSFRRAAYAIFRMMNDREFENLLRRLLNDLQGKKMIEAVEKAATQPASKLSELLAAEQSAILAKETNPISTPGMLNMLIVIVTLSFLCSTS